MEREIVKISNLAEMRANLLIMIAAMEAKGFTKCENLVRMKAELVALDFDRYKEKYPYYMFFTDEKFDEIVKRNNLVVTQVSEYTGTIPDECWKMIEAENIDKDDLRKPMYIFHFSVLNNSSYLDSSGQESTLEEYESLKSKSAEDIAAWISKWPFGTEKIHHSPEWILNCLYNGTYKGYMETRPINIELIEKEKNDGLYIAAPEHMTTGKKIKALPRVLSSFQAKPLDPIVFRKVKDGILVISFWK